MDEPELNELEQQPELGSVPPPGPVLFSNGIRLNGRQWLGVAAFAVVLVLCAPPLWERLEPFEPGPDYRVPHELGNDYWLYERYARHAAGRYDTVVIGDSVIWGEYVTREQTLSHYLNEQAGGEQFANLGLDGAHPLALGGLVEHYAGVVIGKTVILQCNPLWLTSPRHDLQEDKDVQINHPRLIPQFVPKIPCYHEEYSTRIGVAIEQRVPFNVWTNHLQQAYYDRTDIPGWTLEHPFENPLRPLTRGLPPADESLRHEPLPWYKSGITVQDYPWVDLETSLQWTAFRQVVEVLQQRGNRIFVLVGPFNEHLLSPASRQRYQAIQATIRGWLEARQIAHLAPAALPSAQFGDASHPLAEGYAALARQLFSDSFFKR